MYTSPSSPILRCHKIEDLNINWEMPIPEILTGLNCMSIKIFICVTMTLQNYIDSKIF